MRIKGVCGFLALDFAIVLLEPMIFASNGNVSHTEFQQHVKAIYPYELFQKVFSNVTEPANFISKENYATYLGIVTKEFERSFTLEEVRHIARFYQSPLGQKLIEYQLRSKALDTFLSTISRPDIWTCGIHSQIQLPDPGVCPICGRVLVRKVKANGRDVEPGEKHGQP